MDTTDLVPRFANYLDSGNISALGIGEDMDDEDISMAETPVDASSVSPDSEQQSALEKQHATLKTYLDSVPYKCETPEEMDVKLAEIVDKIFLCATSGYWHLLPGWNEVFNYWLQMRYPINKPVRVRLLQYYYEFALVPGIDPNLIRVHVNMFANLLPRKHNASRILDTGDLELDWKPLWRALKKELSPKKRLYDPTRNVANILLYLAERSRRYFPAKEIPNMLETFLPLLTKETVLIMVPVLTSFLPPTNAHHYMPMLFTIWEAFNSGVIDDRFIDFMGELAEDHVSGTAGSFGDQGVPWKDVGIWTVNQWTLLMSKCLGSMNVPVGATKGASSTAGHADALSGKQSVKLKKNINRYSSLAKLMVYSISVDGPIKSESTGANTPASENAPLQGGYLAGSKALDSLEKFITSTESFFHPSNTGLWTLTLSSFLQRLAAEFTKRWKEEEDPHCKTPEAQRLTPAIRRAFVLTLRTPMLLALFAKDLASMGLAQGALRSMSLLEPALVMPQLLERAYSGLEVVNETHRTTAVLSMLSGVALPLVSEQIWRGGQRHLVPLLELCIPGIDLNDPAKTICASMFICSAIQHIRVGDLSIHAQSIGALTADDGPSEGALTDVVTEEERLPEGIPDAFNILSKTEERALVRDSTAAFSDWVALLFRRVFALYENLPEEGGKKNTTGGKQEESVLKTIKNTLDVVCLHLSDQHFDLVLKLVHDYVTTNAKSNAVRAIGQLIACLARAKPQKTLDKFLPFCVDQIKDELRHGASSVRTTSSHAAIPSDTTLHWNMSILRGCLGYGGPAVLKHKAIVLELVNLLIDKTKSERGYSSAGRLLTRLLHTLSGVYPLNSRFVNTSEWESEEFEKSHNLHWGRMYEAKDVVIEWHVPSNEEISFIIEIIEHIASPLITRLEQLLNVTLSWDNSARNDFCRYLYAVRSVWAGLPTIIKEQANPLSDPCLQATRDVLPELLPMAFDIEAGFVLTNPDDPRYQVVANHRAHFGRVIHQAAQALQGNVGGEDHIDAVLGVAKAIDIYLLEYGVTKSVYIGLQKNYALARDLNRTWPRQKENSRLVFLKRAQVYHNARVSIQSLRRHRSPFDLQVVDDLIELCLSPYTRVRRYSQGVLYSVCDHYPLSKRYLHPKMIATLTRGTDPDRMKGALFVLSSKMLTELLRTERECLSTYMTSLLDCQHQEKPSIQKLVTAVTHDLLMSGINEESLRRLPSLESFPQLHLAAKHLRAQFSALQVDYELLEKATQSMSSRTEEDVRIYNGMVARVIEIARKTTTHWRYLQMAMSCLLLLLRRDIPQDPMLAKLLAEITTKSHPATRTLAQRGLVKLLAFVKIRSYSSKDADLWQIEWRNPLQRELKCENANELLTTLQAPFMSTILTDSGLYVDKVTSGFLVSEPAVKAYTSPTMSSPLSLVWNDASRDPDVLSAIETVIGTESYFSDLLALWAQESDARGATTVELELRKDHVQYIKTLGKMFEAKHLDKLLDVVEPLINENDRFKQRAGAELIAGILRGSKHWIEPERRKLWDWFISRLPVIYAQVKPDTVTFWEGLILDQLINWDPKRNKPLIEWLLSLPLEFHSDSAFAMSKTLGAFSCLVVAMGVRFAAASDRYIDLYFDNAHTSYAEIRAYIASTLGYLMSSQWTVPYSSVGAFLIACREGKDPMKIRHPRHLRRIEDFREKLQAWRLERLPPPRTNQSQFDKVSLTLLTWIWSSGHGAQATSIFPYVVPIIPDILKMTDLNDHPELQMYSSAALYVLSAVTPPNEYVEIVADSLITTLKASQSWKIKLNGLPILIVFFYRNLISFSEACIARLMDVVIFCLGDENVEVRETAAKLLAGLLRCSQRRRILPLRNRFVAEIRSIKLPARQSPGYADSLRALHSAILGICALVESFPYSVEPWMPPLTEVLAPHASDPPPISTTIRKCASEFKKTHQDTWHSDQQLFDEDQLQALSNMLIGTSYYA